jgi:hypothetical protein
LSNAKLGVWPHGLRAEVGRTNGTNLKLLPVRLIQTETHSYPSRIDFTLARRR